MVPNLLTRMCAALVAIIFTGVFGFGILSGDSAGVNLQPTFGFFFYPEKMHPLTIPALIVSGTLAISLISGYGKKSWLIIIESLVVLVLVSWYLQTKLQSESVLLSFNWLFVNYFLGILGAYFSYFIFYRKK